MAAASVVSRYQVFQHEDLFLILSWDRYREMVDGEYLFFVFLLHESLFDFVFLFFADLDHNFFDPDIHFFSVFVSTHRLSVGPWMFHDLIDRYTFFRVRIQHFLYEI